MSTIIYGIKNCDTIKKAIKWLEAKNIPFTFHDYRKDGLDKELIESFIHALDWESLINKRGTSFRKLPEETKEKLSKSTAIELMLENAAIIKRPILIHLNQHHLGFSAKQYDSIFTKEA